MIYHCRGDAGPQAEAVGQVGGNIKLAATDMNLACRCFAERDDPRIQAMDKGANRHEVQGTILADVQTIFHSTLLGFNDF
ncbi:MAG: hypothetical protein PVF79_01775 [Desulfobacterales bacterium]